MTINDFEEFKRDISWFIKFDDDVTVEQGSLNLSAQFKATFPLLHGLIMKARILSITINDDKYNLLSWDSTQHKPCGWLC